MVLLNSYHALIEKDPMKISPLWKVCQIILYTVAAIGGLTCAYTFGFAKIAFSNNCLLYANLKFQDGSGSKIHPTSTPLPNITAEVIENAPWEAPTNELLVKPNDTNTTTLDPITTQVSIDLINSEWGDSVTCNYVQFCSLVSFILGCVWITMFWMCSRGGAGYATELHQPWRIVYPSMFFTAVIAIVMCINTMWLTKGTELFCAEFEPIFNTKKCTPGINDFTLTFDENIPVSAYLQVAIIGSAVSLSGWVAALLLLLLRLCCVTDFDLVTVRISSKEEEDTLTAVVHEIDNKSITDSIISEDTQTDSITASKSYPISPPAALPPELARLSKEVKFHLPSSVEDDDSLAELGSESIDRPLLEATERMDKSKIKRLDSKGASDTDSSISPIATKAVLDEFNDYDVNK